MLFFNIRVTILLKKATKENKMSEGVARTSVKHSEHTLGVNEENGNAYSNTENTRSYDRE